MLLKLRIELVYIINATWLPTNFSTEIIIEPSAVSLIVAVFYYFIRSSHTKTI